MLYSRGLEKRAKCVLEGLRRNGKNVLEECTAIQAALDTKRDTTVSMFYYMKFILTKYRLKALAVISVKFWKIQSKMGGAHLGGSGGGPLGGVWGGPLGGVWGGPLGGVWGGATWGGHWEVY